MTRFVGAGMDVVMSQLTEMSALHDQLAHLEELVKDVQSKFKYEKKARKAAEKRVKKLTKRLVKTRKSLHKKNKAKPVIEDSDGDAESIDETRVFPDQGVGPLAKTRKEVGISLVDPGMCVPSS